MRIVGVVDLRGGLAVHARAGSVRGSYSPVVIPGAPDHPGDALALVRFYHDVCGLQDVYVADLDAIAGQPPQYALVAELARLGLDIWLDAAIASPVTARAALASGAHTAVVGLETLPDFGALSAICAAVGGARVAFSLDLNEGRPILVANAPPCHSVELIASQVAQAGAKRLIVLDLARVGTGRGVDLDLLRRIASRAPDCELYAGGGVADAMDIGALDAAGIAGALVATALLSGRLRRGV